MDVNPSSTVIIEYTEFNKKTLGMLFVMAERTEEDIEDVVKFILDQEAEKYEFVPKNKVK